MKLSRGAHVRLSSSAFHILLLVAGAAFLLTDAFHGNVWFDESYSVGIANHSFADIWYYSSGDVHPVLIYWALHVLNLVFGQNITIYRLFTVAGAIALVDHVLRVQLGVRVPALFRRHVGVHDQCRAAIRTWGACLATSQARPQSAA